MFEWADLWDKHCEDLERRFAELKKENPGCATCANYKDNDTCDERGYCRVLHEIVEGYGEVPCEYENYRVW